jgi:hypothetical protein
MYLLKCDEERYGTKPFFVSKLLWRVWEKGAAVMWIKGKASYPCNRPWRPIGLWDVEGPTLSRQSAHRWRWGCQPYAPATLYPPGRFLILISVRGWVDPNWKIHLIGTRTRDLPGCSIMPQPTTLSRAPMWIKRGMEKSFGVRCVCLHE